VVHLVALSTLVLLALVGAAPVQGHAQATFQATPIVTQFNTTLQPGVWHGFVIGPSSLERGYVAEISPLQPSVDGAHIERYVVQPEFDGVQWNDVLRVQLPLDTPALEANIRIYHTARLPIVTQFNTTLEPGVWHGFVIGPSSLERGYVAEISPLQPSVDGAHIERYVVQPEFDGVQWNDVLRVQLSLDTPALEANIKVYRTKR
jgi:hypothetical protein